MEHEGDNYTNRDWCFGTVTKGTIQTIELLRTVRLLRKILEICCHSDSSEKASAKADMQKSQGKIIIN